MKWLRLLTILPSTLFGAIQGDVSSDTISFDGEAFHLNGAVQMKHPFGYLTSRSASLKKKQDFKNELFSTAILQDEVHIQLKNDSQIQCDLARIDFERLTGDLTAIKRYVIFEDQIEHNGSTYPLLLKSRNAHFKMIKRQIPQQEDFEIDYLNASGDVVAIYNHEYRLSSDSATYQRFSLLDSQFRPKLPDGMIRFYQQRTPCQLESDTLQLTASSIVFDMKHNSMQMLNAEGTYNLGDSPTHFSTMRAQYKMNQELLTLQGKSSIKTARNGELNTTEWVELTKKKAGKLSDISHIKTRGEMTYRYLGDTFSCNGTTHLNHQAELFEAHYKLEESRKPTPQITYVNEDFTVEANHVKMSYDQEHEIIEMVELSGDIEIEISKEGAPLQIAQCERLLFYPQDRKIILMGEGTEQVMLWDHSDSMTLSADEIHILIDPETKEKTIHSVGEMRCLVKEVETLKWKKALDQS